MPDSHDKGTPTAKEEAAREASAPAGLRKGHVAVRLDPATIARLDAILPLYALPGRDATRSDGLRAVILAGLEVEERRAARVLGSNPEGGGRG